MRGARSGPWRMSRRAARAKEGHSERRVRASTVQAGSRLQLLPSRVPCMLLVATVLALLTIPVQPPPGLQKHVKSRVGTKGLKRPKRGPSHPPLQLLTSASSHPLTTTSAGYRTGPLYTHGREARGDTSTQRTRRRSDQHIAQAAQRVGRSTGSRDRGRRASTGIVPTVQWSDRDVLELLGHLLSSSCYRRHCPRSTATRRETAAQSLAPRHGWGRALGQHRHAKDLAAIRRSLPIAFSQGDSLSTATASVCRKTRAKETPVDRSGSRFGLFVGARQGEQAVTKSNSTAC